MPHQQQTGKRSIGWMGLKRGHRANPFEWIVERAIFLIATSAILMVFLIFLFVAREALPVFLGQTNSSLVQEVLPVAKMDTLSPAELQKYLGLTPKQFRELDRDAIQALMEVKLEGASELTKDKDAAVNTTQWRYMLLPHQWSDYDHPVFIWQPVSQIHKYNIIPLAIGSLKLTLVALLFSVPIALGAAIYVSQLAGNRARELLKPAIELLAGIPSVVLGFFSLIVLASFFQNLLGYQVRLNSFVAGIALGLAVIPVVFSIAEDALSSVPRSYTQAALALGSSRWQTAWQIVLPAALPGVFAAVVLGFGRAIGETMVVLMASGNASIVSWNIFDSTRSVTATIAAELAETVFGGHHYRILFMLGTLLFAVTFLSNLAANRIIRGLKSKMEGKR
ncbi:MAG: phosphate ABC transporter permease subunit PstC [Verrucomicrobia bacterium]|nr:phosphate ABC transporter permease subunit PstC [Verrucomicrobiota bacterium]